MGTKISVPLGAYVVAYNDTGATKTYGDQVAGDKLRASYIPGSYPYFDTFTPEHKFECRGYTPLRASTLWQRVA